MMLGSITRDRNRYRARVSVDGRRVSIGSFESKADAHGAIAEFRRLHAAEVSAVPGLISLAEWGTKYLDARETDGFHRNIDSARSVWAARIAPTKLAGMSVDVISPRDVRAWLSETIRQPSERTGRPLSRQTVLNALNLLRVALEAAVEAGHCDTNPARDVRVPRMARDTEHWSWLREDEVDRLLACDDVDPERRRIFTVAIFTGLREGELWGLRWSDIDWKLGELIVARSFAQPTKGGRVRRVPMLAPVRTALERQRGLRTCELVFAKDGRMRPRGDIAGLDRALAAAGVRRVRFHDLRHTCASHLVQGTWAPDLVDGPLRLEDVRVWLGHKSMTTTERYAHLCPGAVRSRVRGADAPTRKAAWTHLDALVAADIAQLAGIIEPPIRIELMTYGLRNPGKTERLRSIEGQGVRDASTLVERARELLASYARRERPSDDAVVRVLAEVVMAGGGAERGDVARAGETGGPGRAGG